MAYTQLHVYVFCVFVSLWLKNRNFHFIYADREIVGVKIHINKLGGLKVLCIFLK